jgi:anaerobic selenocysteine-containing dehydrogenase
MTDTDPTRIAHRICPLCEACCGLELKVTGNRIDTIKGNPNDVFSQGYICPKGVALRDLHDDPDRLTTPMIKRNGRHEPISYEEAFGEIERRLTPILATYGRSAAGVYLGNPGAHKMGLLLYSPHLIRALGTPNVFSASTLDQMPKQVAAGLMFGTMLSIAVPDIDHTDHLIILGANPMASNGSLWTVPDFRGRVQALQARGGKLITIDPRRTETAQIADAHHFIRPGSDVFLLLGMAATLIEEGLVETGPLALYLNGLDEAMAAIRPYPPERIAGNTGLSAQTIRQLARDMAAAPRAVLYGRIGTCTQEFGTLASWLIDVINILTGNLDRIGGAMFSKSAAFAANTRGKPGQGRGFDIGRRKSRVSGAPEAGGEFPVGCMAEEIETPGDGQIKALFVVAGNPVLSAPNGKRLSQALEQLELMVSLDIYLNETSRHADVILPGLSPLEEGHFDVAFPQMAYRNAARYSAPVFPRAPGCLSEWENLLRLAAIARGHGANVDPRQIDDQNVRDQLAHMLPGDQVEAAFEALSKWRGPERQVDLALRMGPHGDQFGAKPDGLNLELLARNPNGIDLGDLMPRIPESLRTQSGKIDMAPPAIIGDLVRVEDALGRPKPDLVIIGRRHVRSNNSWMHNLPVLAKGPNRCTLIVHSEDAARLGLRQGGLAQIIRGNRAIEAEVAISNDIMPGVVSLPHGFGHDLAGINLSVAQARPGANLNALLDDDDRDPLSGTSILSGIAVAVAPAAAAV